MSILNKIRTLGIDETEYEKRDRIEADKLRRASMDRIAKDKESRKVM